MFGAREAVGVLKASSAGSKASTIFYGEVRLLPFGVWKAIYNVGQCRRSFSYM